ncbi:hypothetical protein JQ582_41190 [Bradyrhizobium japonicum]|jgi:hypothetical protein|uniref:Transposase n=1 Tax=Bradyrhizobium japonicum TaxID=375 RepID=A0A1L3F946_BRAJP|nr:hypothetical protein [Bradyrhizobium japonicum]APG09840.1 hypothetical protein BKD09_16005 [Bradyrhizobium japonicum]MBR0730423.1 hypothetical protein [Bradyrhizobium japonicum]MBR0750326.1 hypothetical protein [Bradyrhizobium japonicum]MBR0808411.1 hypothetical protein [Bradyrhizobium japonicum]MBR0914338.1 hypothetical protein [Bradyrhizobium japonicum]
MSDPVRRPWTSEEIEKLKAMAGNHRREKIAAELNRGAPAVALKAHQLGISLRYHADAKASTTQSAPGR